jgi:hypothetical protein
VEDILANDEHGLVIASGQALRIWSWVSAYGETI